MRKCILIVFISFYSLSTYGQMQFGVKGGMNINKWVAKGSSGFEDDGEKSLGFHLGLYGEMAISERFFFIPELQYTQRGMKYQDINGDVRLNLNYLELPLLISYSPVNKLQLCAGPSFAYKISAVVRSDGSSHNVDHIYDNNFDAGIAFGVRFQLMNKFMITSNYYYGLLPVSEVYWNDFSNEGKISFYNRNIHFGVGYQLK